MRDQILQSSQPDGDPAEELDLEAQVEALLDEVDQAIGRVMMRRQSQEAADVEEAPPLDDEPGSVANTGDVEPADDPPDQPATEIAAAADEASEPDPENAEARAADDPDPDDAEARAADEADADHDETAAAIAGMASRAPDPEAPEPAPQGEPSSELSSGIDDLLDDLEGDAGDEVPAGLDDAERERLEAALHADRAEAGAFAEVAAITETAPAVVPPPPAADVAPKADDAAQPAKPASGRPVVPLDPEWRDWLGYARRLIVWALGIGGRLAWRELCRGASLASPHLARGLVLASRPLDRQPPAVRSAVGWIGIYTMFLAAILWMYVLFFRDTKRPEPPSAPITLRAEDGGRPATN